MLSIFFFSGVLRFLYFFLYFGSVFLFLNTYKYMYKSKWNEFVCYLAMYMCVHRQVWFLGSSKMTYTHLHIIIWRKQNKQTKTAHEKQWTTLNVKTMMIKKIPNWKTMRQHVFIFMYFYMRQFLAFASEMLNQIGSTIWINRK